RIFRQPRALMEQPWFWTITPREQPPSVYNRGYAASREQAMPTLARRAISSRPIEMQNDQNPRPGFLESALEHPRLVVVAIIAVVFVSMVLHLL
ncbi:MAG: hypothetical protein WA753_23715, partial [Pseudolabrys sp.]